MAEPTIPTVVSGQLAQSSSQWNTMVRKVQDTTDGHRHDGVGSYGPLTNFSGATFTTLSANTLNVSGLGVFGGPVTVSGPLGVTNLSVFGTEYVAGNASFGGTLVVQSAISPGVYGVPGNLSSSGIVAQLVAGSNITVSSVGGTGVVAVGVGGTTVFAGTNQSFGSVVLGSTLVSTTLTVNGLTTLSSTVVGNLSDAGSVFVQSRSYANDAVITNNLSAGSVYITGTLGVVGVATFSSGMALSNVSTSTETVGQITLGSGLATQISAGGLFAGSGSFTTLTVGSSQEGFLTNLSGIKAFTLSAAGTVTIQSRMIANDAVITGNFSAGSIFAGSAQFTNVSTNTAVIGSAQIGYLNNTSTFQNLNANTSAGYFRIFALSAGRTYQTLNAQNQNAFPDVSGLPQWLHYFDVQGTPTAVWNLAPSSGTQNAVVTLYSAGAAITLNLSAASLVAGSAQFTNVSTNTVVTGSANVGNLMNTALYIIPNQSTNTSSGNYRVFALSSGRTYHTLNTTNASAIPDVSGNPILMTYMDNLSATPAQFGFQVATSGTINTPVIIQSGLLAVTGGITATGNVSHGAGVSYAIRTTTASTNTSSNDYLIVANGGATGIAISLTRAASSLGQALVVYAQSGTGSVTVYATSTDQIDFNNNQSAITLGGLLYINSAVTRLIAYNASTWLQI